MGSKSSMRGLILLTWLVLAGLGLLGCTSSTSSVSSTSTQTSQQTTVTSATTSLAPSSSVTTSSTTTSSLPGLGDPTPIQLDLGPADTIKLHEAWMKIGEAGGFDADAASPDVLELSYTLSGSLVRLLIVARTDDGKAVTVQWAGLEGPADQKVVVTGEVLNTVATLLRRPDRVAPFLAAFDGAGPARMMAVLKPDDPGAICDVSPIFRRFEPDTTSPGRLNGYVWEGEALVPLERGDPRFADERHYVHLYAAARVIDSYIRDLSGTRDLANFVLPIPEGLASTSTETTLAPSPGGLLIVEEGDLASASVSVHSYGGGSGPAEYPIDLTDPAERRSLLALLNGLEKEDQLWNGGLFPVRLRVTLTDGQECSVFWFEEQPMELMTVTNATANRGCRTVVESPEMSAFLESYLQYRE